MDEFEFISGIILIVLLFNIFRSLFILIKLKTKLNSNKKSHLINRYLNCKKQDPVKILFSFTKQFVSLRLRKYLSVPSHRFFKPLCVVINRTVWGANHAIFEAIIQQFFRSSYAKGRNV